MNSNIQFDNEFLGADTELSPEVIAFLTAPSSAQNITEKACTRHVDKLMLDEHEQALVA